MRLLLALLILAAPAAAGAKVFSIKGHDISLDLTDTVAYTYHLDNGDRALFDDNFHQFMNVLDVGLGYGIFRLGGRFDLHLFANTPFSQRCPDPALTECNEVEERYVNAFVPERISLTAAHSEFDVTLGDFYASLGKGIALNVVKIDELGQDTTIRGGKFVVHHRDLELTVLGGWEFNVLDTDEATGRKTFWERSPVLASRLEYRFFDAVIAGAHGVYMVIDDGRDTLASHGDHHAVWGAGLEAPSLWEGALSLATEVDLQRTVSAGQIIRGPDADEGVSGLAAYASASLQLGAFTLLGEYKYYDDFHLQAPDPQRQGKVKPYDLIFNQPPTLERNTAEVYNNRRVQGGRLRVDWNLGARGPLEILLFVNYGFFRNHSETKDQHSVHDPYAGLELEWQEGEGHAHLTGGLRREQNDTAAALYRQDGHLELDLEQLMVANHSVKLNATILFRQRQDALSDDAWKELGVTLGYKWSPRLALSITYERQEDPQIVGSRQGNGDPAAGPLRDEPLLGPANYLGGSAQYYFTPSSYVGLRAGQTRPGIKCMNGVCRQFPAFAGVQLNVVARY